MAILCECGHFADDHIASTEECTEEGCNCQEVTQINLAIEDE